LVRVNDPAMVEPSGLPHFSSITASAPSVDPSSLSSNSSDGPAHPASAIGSSSAVHCLVMAPPPRIIAAR
jgi:hypothetical protein